MAKPPTIYPVSADLSALLGAAVDVDTAWAEPLDLEASKIRNRPVSDTCNTLLEGIWSRWVTG